MRSARIESVAEMQFEEAAFFFDDENSIEAVGEIAREFLIEREGHPELGDADAEIFQLTFADTEIAERLCQIVIGFTSACEAEPCSLFWPTPAIQFIQPGELEDGLQAPRVDFIFEPERDGGNESRGDGFLIALWNNNLRQVWIEGDCASGIADFSDEFQSDPGAGKSRNGDG